MTEAQYTAKFIKYIRKNFLGWEVIKFNDRVTRGIPDLCISNGKATVWLEAKVYGKKRPAYQRWMLIRLGGKYIVFDEYGCWLESPEGAVDRTPVLEYLKEVLC